MKSSHGCCLGQGPRWNGGDSDKQMEKQIGGSGRGEWKESRHTYEEGLFVLILRYCTSIGFIREMPKSAQGRLSRVSVPI